MRLPLAWTQARRTNYPPPKKNQSNLTVKSEGKELADYVSFL
ncbi:protein of unknown function [Bradyrhizobium sp. ORS 285]|nr:protein of unknown function [Bradyrhizobium sp. ORS 285]